MKKFDKILIFNLLMLFAISTQAQNYQMPKWPFNGKEIDFTVAGNPVVNNMNSYLAGAKGSTGGYYDTNNNLLFNVIDTKLYAPDGTLVGDLYTDSDATPDKQCGEMIIAPVLRQNTCKYWVIYPMQVYNSDNTTYWKVCYNLVCSYGPTILESGVISSTSGTWHGGIAMSDFLPNTDAHRLFIVVPNANTTIVQQWTIDDRISLLATAEFGAPLIDIAELDLSTDRTMLVCAKLNLDGYDALGENVVVFHYLSNGSVNMSIDNGMTILDIGTANATNEQFTGIEVYQNPSNSSQKYIYVSKSGGSRYKIDMTNPNSPITTIVNGGSYGSQSFIEWDYDTYISSSNGSNALFRNLPTQTTATLTTIGSYNPVKNLYISDFHTNAPDVYTLPDQIDGCTYQYTNGTEVSCCEIATESRIKTTMTGVTEETNGDITIESGNTVSWYTNQNPFTTGAAITDIYMRGDIIIEPGARLNITGLTLHFKEGQEVQLNAAATSGGTGAKLYLYSGSKLTAFDNCESDAMWEGIDVTGNWQYSQTTGSAQPYLYMSSAAIEYANIGVDAPTGGKVSATLSNFKDNLIDVKFNSYAGYDNTSSFDRCDFYTTGDLYTIKGLNPQYHAQIYNAPGVLFKACDFYNNYAYQNQISVANWGVGILATGSYVTIQHRCASMQDPCPAGSTTRGTFSHLKYGIKADQGDYLIINRCDFNDCVAGAWLIGNDAITATENIFDVFDYWSVSTNPYDVFGLYIESSTSYHVEQNTFDDGIIGLIIYNSGDEENLVYKNTFTDLEIAFIGIGDNTGYPYEKDGLQLRCNTFNGVDYAMSVLGGSLVTANGLITVSNSDIRQIQGDLGLSEVSAYNYFNTNETTDYNHFFINPNVSNIIYRGDKYQYNQTNSAGYYLQYYNSNYVAVEWYAAQTCPSTLSSGGGIQLGMQAINDLNENEENAMTELNEILSYNEALLLANAETANSFASSSVFNSLAEQSPNLTAEIILAYVNNPNVSELSKVSLLLSNSPLPTAVIDALETTGISPEYINFVLQHQYGENPVEKLQNQLSAIKSAKQTKYDQLVRETFAADTTPEFADTYNMVIGFMANQKNVVAMKRLVKLYVHKALYAYALDVISDINETALTDNDTNLENYCRIASIQIEMQQQCSSEPMLDIVKRHEIELLEMAANYNTKEGGIARAILESVGLMTNEPIVFLPQTDNAKSARVTQPQRTQAPSTAKLKSLFRIYPNPANDQLAIEFVNPQEGNCTFNVYSMKGELLQTVNSSQQLGFITIPVSQLAPGTYIIECPQLKSKTSFVISR